MFALTIVILACPQKLLGLELAQEEQIGIEERHREGWRRTDGAKGQLASAGSWLALGKALGGIFTDTPSAVDWVTLLKAGPSPRAAHTQ